LHPLDLVLDNVLRGFCHKLEHLQQPQPQRVLALVRRQLVNGGVNSCQPAVEFDPLHHLLQRACVAWGGQPHKRLTAPHASLGQNAVRTYRTACCFVRTNRLQVTVHRSCKNAHPKTPRPPAAAVIVPPGALHFTRINNLTCTCKYRPRPPTGRRRPDVLGPLRLTTESGGLRRVPTGPARARLAGVAPPGPSGITR
jgi:hypothetical protein